MYAQDHGERGALRPAATAMVIRLEAQADIRHRPPISAVQGRTDMLFSRTNFRLWALSGLGQISECPLRALSGRRREAGF
jgi:hypothetical protein